MSFSEPKRFAKTIFLTVFVIMVLLLIFSYFVALFLGPRLFFFTPEGLNASELYVESLPVWLFTIVGFGVPVGFNIGVIFLFLWGVFAICIVAAWRFRECLHEVIGKSFSRPIKKLFNNCLFAMPVISSMMLLAVIFIEVIQQASGISTGQPPWRSNPFEFFFEISYAAVAEEIGFRIFPIGAFLIIYLFWVGGKNAVSLSNGQRLKLFFAAPLFPDEAKKIVGAQTVGDFGVRGGISSGEWILIFFTSIIFGSAHYLLGGGWEIGKISSASVVGLAMGLAYLLYGFQAPILLHWFFNQYLWFFDSTEVGGLQFVSSLHPDLPLAFALIELVIIGVGVLGWLVLMIQGLRKLFRRKAKRVEANLTSLPPTC